MQCSLALRHYPVSAPAAAYFRTVTARSNAARQSIVPTQRFPSALDRVTIRDGGIEGETDMPKPIMNLDEVTLDDVEANGIYTSGRGTISDHIGARNLGYNLTILPPGKAQCPFHSHHGEEEMFFILEGEGELRFGEERLPLRAHDVIACPPGGPEVAHQIINTGTIEMRYLAVSTLVEVDACEYPDSGKVMVVAGERGKRRLRKMFRAETDVDYYDREEA